MSIKSWIREFYPVDARKVSTTKAIDHSIRKWSGLLKKNLKKHNVVLNGCHLGDLLIDSSSCALCQHSIKKYGNCSKCPIYIVRGDPCALEYDEFDQRGNVRPMLNLLKKTKKEYKKWKMKRTKKV